MMYITYTEKNMMEFLTYNRENEVVIVDPLFTKLQEHMFLDDYTIYEETDLKMLDHKKFNHKYMMKNRPVVVREMAKEWGAVAKWYDF